MTTIKAATSAYETWLRSRGPVVEGDLKTKHDQMAADRFPFLRATFYRWAETWPLVCPELAAAPVVLAIGDLHVENFGTWRDAEGRLIWGVNDADEAQPMPYTLDLTRLATSALITLKDGRLSSDEVCDALLDGYGDWLAKDGHPYVLEEDHGWLRALALSGAAGPEAFWKKMAALPAATPPEAARAPLLAQLPPGAVLDRFASRTSGLGSLGRQRFVALAEWRGGLVAREVKAALPSAWGWAHGRPADPIRCADVLTAAARCPDPFQSFVLNADRTGGWAARRLAPESGRIELGSLPDGRDDKRLLRAMGRETANIHLGSPEAVATVRADLKARGGKWLRRAAEAMADATVADWKAWRG